MKKILKNIKRCFSHFQAKLLAAFLLCTLIPLGIIGGISYSVSYSIARDRILNASMSSDEQLNMQINERLEQVENVADSLQYDMYALMQADTPMDSLASLTDTRNDVSLFKTTFRLFYTSVFLPQDHLGIGEKQLAEIRHTLDSKIVDFEKHFGIGNVNKRISNPYFGNGHISIDSRLYHGTKITIEFNQMEEENEESNDC